MFCFYVLYFYVSVFLIWAKLPEINNGWMDGLASMQCIINVSLTQLQ